MQKAMSGMGRSGFTIAELLIVIVVIAILAAISIATYGGIRDRANITQTVQGVAAYAKGVSNYATNNGVYPAAGQFGCLPDAAGNTTCSQVGTGTSTCFGLDGASVKSAIDTPVRTEMPVLPSVSSQSSLCQGQPYRGAFMSVSSDGKTTDFYVYFKGDIQCPSISGLQLAARVQTDDVTLCRMRLPIL